MLNYWVIPVLFALIAIILGKASEWLVSFKMFLGNVAMLWYSYNGAGGVSTYILMVLLSMTMFYLMKKYLIVLDEFGLFTYIITYMLHFKLNGLQDYFWL